jgi:RNA polymerase sigma-70 factor (ECF subfamily)
MSLLEPPDKQPGFLEESDEAILMSSQRRPQLFSILLDRYQEAFLRKAEQIVGNREDAEDVVQETFTKIYLHGAKFQVQEGASFKSWAYKILLNTSFSHYQKLKKRNAATTSLSAELEAILPDRTSRNFEKMETGDYVLSVLERMSQPFRRVLHLYFIDGKSQAEIAKEEGVSVGAIKTRMHRAKAEFRKIVTILAD